MGKRVKKVLISITNRYFPNRLHLGDITKIDDENSACSYHYIWFTLSKFIKYRVTRRPCKKSIQFIRSLIEEMSFATNEAYLVIAVWKNVVDAL